MLLVTALKSEQIKIFSYDKNSVLNLNKNFKIRSFQGFQTVVKRKVVKQKQQKE